METPDKKESLEDLAVPPSPTAAPAVAPSTSWWNPLSFFYSTTPVPAAEDAQRQQQIREREALEATVLSAQAADDDDDFVPVDVQQPIEVEVHLLSTQELKAQQEATRALEEQELRQEQELKAQQEATMTTPSTLYGLLGSSTPAAPSTQTEPDLTAIVPDDPTNASNVPTANISQEEVNYVFRPSTTPIDPHPGAELAIHTGVEEARAIQHATEQSTRDLPTNKASPTSTQPAETKEENETAVFDAAEETDQAEAQLRMEAEALETAQRLAEEQARAREEQARQDILRAAEEQARAREEQARQDILRAAAEQARAREEQARQDILRAAAEQARVREEQARIEREERARQDAILLQQQLLLQRQLEQQRLEQERQRAAEAKAAEEKEAAEIAFSKYCSTGERTPEAHYKKLRAAILEGGF